MGRSALIAANTVPLSPAIRRWAGGGCARIAAPRGGAGIAAGEKVIGRGSEDTCAGTTGELSRLT